MYKLVLLLLLCNCRAVAITDELNTQVSDILAVYKHEMECPTPRVHISFSRGTMEEAGYCLRTKRQIVLSYEYWQILSPLGREQLLLHELGHCALGLDHDKSRSFLRNQRGTYLIPTSIMWHIVIGEDTSYLEFRDYYINQLAVAGGCIKETP